MEFVYPYQYNVHDTTYYYYEPPMVEVVDSMGMMSMSPVSSGSMGPVSLGITLLVVSAPGGWGSVTNRPGRIEGAIADPFAPRA